jgi:uncharacterized membrane protein YeaQ/YmgE (transglycosylase-associated protein family)
MLAVIYRACHHQPCPHENPQAKACATVDVPKQLVYKECSLRTPRAAITAAHSQSKTGGAMLSGLLWWAIVGLIAGFLAGKVMKGGGFGVIMDIVIGIIGAIIGGWVFGLLGIFAGGLIGSIIVAFVGACILLWIVRLIKKA